VFLFVPTQDRMRLSHGTSLEARPGVKNSRARAGRHARRTAVWPGLLLALFLWQGSASAIAAAPPEDQVVATPPRLAVQRLAIPLAGVRDEAAMMIVGAALIGLAAVLRRVA
jgi:hypothetical protein